MSTIGDRIRLLMHFKKLNATQLADILQVQRSSISHILTGRNKPSLDFVQKVISEFPEVSYDWLINGAGNLSRPSSKDSSNIDTSITTTQSTRDTNVIQQSPPLVTDVSVKKSKINTSVTPEEDLAINSPRQAQVTPPNTQVKSALPNITKVIIFYEDGSYQEIKHQ